MLSGVFLIRKPKNCSILSPESGVVLMFLESCPVGTQIPHVTSAVAATLSLQEGTSKDEKTFAIVCLPGCLVLTVRGHQSGRESRIRW